MHILDNNQFKKKKGTLTSLQNEYVYKTKIVCKTSNRFKRKQAPKRRQNPSDENKRTAPDTLIRAQRRVAVAFLGENHRR